MFKKILIASDGSNDALHAAHLAALIARSVPSEVIVLNVFNLGAAIAFLTPDAMNCSEVLIDSGESAQKDILRRTCDLLSQEGVPCRSRAEIGHPIEVTLRIAEEEKVDLIVLGSHGLSGFKKLLLGGVADGVAHHAPCPVLIVRGKTRSIKQILVSVDGSDCSYKALQIGGEIARTLGATIRVLNAVDPTKPRHSQLPADAPPQESIAEHVDVLQEEIGVEYKFHQEAGHAVEVITTFAATNSIDMIVMGSHGYGTFQRLLLGSVSYAVLHHATCPVLIVRTGN